MIPRLLTLVLLCLPLAAQPSDLTAKLTSRIDAALKKSGAPSVSVAVVQNGKIAFAKAFGMAELPNRAADINTRYAVGSISKEFTAAALLMLQEQGKLSLDDPVAKYFPDLTRASEITICQLLAHTSGYEDFAPQDYVIPEWTKPTRPAVILDRWAKKPLNFDPGTKWQYSNTNYAIAGEIFEKVAGQPLVDFLTQKIFAPLEMRSAGDWPPANPADAVAYTRFALGPPRPVQREAKGWYFAAGELCMTPSDLARWDIAFLQKKLLSQRTYYEFTREMVLKDGGRTHYALGLSLGDISGVPFYSHGGEVSGFISAHYIFPTRNAAVIVLSNQDGIALVGPLARQIATILLLPEQPEMSDKDTKQIQSILEDLMKAKINRALFTENANSYFTDAALQDLKTSLATLGKLKTVTSNAENLRGGMTHRTYHAEFEKKTLLLNIYVTKDGKYEQYMVEDQL